MKPTFSTAAERREYEATCAQAIHEQEREDAQWRAQQAKLRRQLLRQVRSSLPVVSTFHITAVENFR